MLLQMALFHSFLWLSTGWFFFFFNKFIYLFLARWVFVAARRLSLVAVSGGPLFVAVRGLLIVMDSLVAEHGL